MWHDAVAREFANALLDASLAKPAGLIGPNGKAAEKRFDVYRNNVAFSLIEALGKNYPAVRAQCGAGKFNDAAQLYLGEHPPRTKIMFNLGDGFSDWLGVFAPAKAQMPWLGDLARLEREWLRAYHAVDASPLDPALLGAIHPDALGEIRLERHPAAAVICSNYAIYTMLEAGRDGSASTAMGAENVLITRLQFAVETRVLPAGAAVFFQAIFADATLGEAAATALSQDASFDLSGSLSCLLQSGATTALL